MIRLWYFLFFGGAAQLGWAASSGVRHDFAIDLDPSAWQVASDSQVAPREWRARFRVATQIDVSCDPSVEDIRRVPPLMLGELCGTPTILMAPHKVFLSQEGTRFVAKHEYFHLIVQRTKIRLPLAVLSAWPSPEELAGIGRFSSRLIEIVEARTPSGCSDLNDLLLGLSDSESAYVVNVSHMEWPAEAYAAASMFGEYDDAKVQSLRGKYGLGSTAGYRPALVVFRAIENRFARKTWQASYASGNHVLNILAASLECGAIVPQGPAGRVRRLNSLGEMLRRN